MPSFFLIASKFKIRRDSYFDAGGAASGVPPTSETVCRHLVEADIRPFRDILLGLFFVTIGMMPDLQYVLANARRPALAVALLLAARPW